MADLEPFPPAPLSTRAAAPSLEYAIPLNHRPRGGAAGVLIVGFLTVILSIVPWGITRAAITGGIRGRSGGSDAAVAIVALFGSLGLIVTVVGLWMMVAAARRLLG